MKIYRSRSRQRLVFPAKVCGFPGQSLTTSATSGRFLSAARLRRYLMSLKFEKTGKCVHVFGVGTELLEYRRKGCIRRSVSCASIDCEAAVGCACGWPRDCESAMCLLRRKCEIRRLRAKFRMSPTVYDRLSLFMSQQPFWKLPVQQACGGA